MNRAACHYRSRYKPYRPLKPIVLCLSAFVVSLFALGTRSSAASSDPSFWFRIAVPSNLVAARVSHASFRLGPDVFLVFAATLPVRQAALAQVTGVAGVSVQHLPQTTVLEIPLQAQQSVGVVATDRFFDIVLGKANKTSPMAPQAIHGKIVFSARGAGPVVTLADPTQGAPLLIGTVSSDAALNRHMQGPGYATIPASNGVVVVALSDELTLAPDKTGFVLSAAKSTLPLPIGNPPVSSRRLGLPVRTKGFDLPDASISALRRRLEVDQQRVASAPPLDRINPSLRLAKTLLSLDLGPEAHGVLTDVVRSDPAAITSKRRRFLLRIADVLSYRPDARAVGTSPSASAGRPSDMWDGLAEAERHHTHRASDLLAATVPLLLALPPLIRKSMLPLAAESLIAGGKLKQAQHLLEEAKNAADLALPRAELLQADHHPHAAAAAYHALTVSPDQRVAGIAQYRSIMLRAQLHRLTPQAAADALAAHVYEWRSAHHEVRVRVSIADFQAQAGEWPDALTGLKRTARLFPAERAAIDDRRRTLFDHMIGSGSLATLAPLPAVAVIETNIDLIPPGASGVSLLKILLARLRALGLPHTASALLDNGFAKIAPGAVRARLGLDLATIELKAHHPKRATASLDRTSAPDIDPALADARAALKDTIAQAIANRAAPILKKAALMVPARPDRARAPGRGSASKAATSVPVIGTLDRTEARIVLQNAVAAKRAKNTKRLADLRQSYLGRIKDHRQSAIFNTLTAPALPANANLSAALEKIAAIERLGTVIRTPTRPTAPHEPLATPAKAPSP